jgi:hypothetical protein
MAQLVWLDDIQIFRRYVFVQVLGQLCQRPDLDPLSAIALARQYAELACKEVFAFGD